MIHITLVKLNGLVYSNEIPLFSNIFLKLMPPKFHSSKRQSIIKAATHMFLTHGYRNTSMDKIALAAPVSKATLYNHFENKNALLSGVVSELCASLLKTMTLTANDEDTVENTLLKIAEAFVDLIYSEEALAIYRLVIAESRDFPELSQLFYISGPQAGINQLQGYLQNLSSRGFLNCPNPTFSADIFFSLLKGDLYMQCLLGLKPLPSEKEKKQLINRIISFYLQGMTHAAS